MVFEVGPKQLARREAKATEQMLTDMVSALRAGNMDRLEELIYEANEAVQAYTKKVLTIGAYVAPAIAVLGVLLICVSLMAVANRREKHRPGRLALVSLAHLVFSFVRVFLLFAFLPLGIYLYIKWYFVILVMLEEKKGLVASIKTSWHMTDGNFWRLLAVVGINTVIQCTMLPTIIGIIPATAFINTVRAAAFRALLDSSEQTEEADRQSLRPEKAS